MRYIKTEEFGFVLSPEGFGEQPTHADLAKRLRCRPVSAGFVRFHAGKPVCYGRSESLFLDSQPEDSKELAVQLGIDERAK